MIAPHATGQQASWLALAPFAVIAPHATGQQGSWLALAPFAVIAPHATGQQGSWLALAPFAVIAPHATGQQRSWLALAAVAVVATIVIALVAERRRSAHAGALVAVAVGVLVLGVYLRTLSPSTDVADSLELQVVADGLRFAHPPGYPLYTMLGKLFTLVPLHDIAWRMNLYSAVTAAAAVVIVYLTATRLTGRYAAAAAAALALAFTRDFWSLALITEVYALNALLVAGVVYALLRWSGDGPHRARWLAVALLGVGLGAVHHLTIVFVAPVVLGAWLANRPGAVLRPRTVAALLGAGLLGLLPAAYLPLRWAAVTGTPPTGREVVAYLTARPYGGLLDLGWPVRDPSRFLMLAHELRSQFGESALVLAAVGWVLAAIGIVWLARRRTQWAIWLVALWVPYVVFRLAYNAWDGWVILLPAHLAMALAVGAGLAALTGLVGAVTRDGTDRRDDSEDGSEGSRVVLDEADTRRGATDRRWWRMLSVGRMLRRPVRLGPDAGRRLAGPVGATAWALAMACLPVALLWSNGPVVDRSAGWAPAALGRQVLSLPLPAGAFVGVDPQIGSALLYPRLIDNHRRDVVVAYADTPAGRRYIDDPSLAAAPVYLLDLAPETDRGYHLRSLGPLIELGLAPKVDLPPKMQIRSAFGVDGAPRLRGYELIWPTPDEMAAVPDSGVPAGDTLGVTLHWQAPEAPAGDYTVHVRLVDDRGRVAAGVAGRPVDGFYPTETWTSGEVVADYHPLAIDAAALPGGHSLQVALAVDGAEPGAGDWVDVARVPVGGVPVQTVARAGVPVDVRWGDSLQLVAYDIPSALRAGDVADVLLYWRRLAGDAGRGPVRVAVHSGVLASSVDAELPGADDWPTGQVIATRHRLALSGASEAGTGEAGASEAGMGDARTGEAGASDADTGDARTGDAGASDADTDDAGASEAVTGDAGTDDAGASEAVTGDAGASDAVTGDAVTGDAGAVDAGARDVAAPVWVSATESGRALPWRGRWLPVSRSGSVRLGAIAIRSGLDGLERPVDFADGLRLVGFQAPHLVRPGQRVWVQLAWEAARRPSGRYKAFVQLLDAGQGVRAGADRELLHGTRPTDGWRQGERFADVFPLDVPADLPAGGYRIQTGLYGRSSGTRLARLDDDGNEVDDRFTFDLAVVPERPPALPHAVALAFGDSLALRGYGMSADVVRPGEVLTATLRWTALAPPPRDYTLFAHLMPAGEDRLVAQRDGPPFGGLLPTSVWPVGVPLDVTTAVRLPSDLAPGTYRLAVGWYDLATGARLPVVSEGVAAQGPAHVAADRIEIPITVAGTADGSVPP